MMLPLVLRDSSAARRADKKARRGFLVRGRCGNGGQSTRGRGGSPGRVPADFPIFFFLPLLCWIFAPKLARDFKDKMPAFPVTP
ncbi:hypothetical protein NDN01_04265 [Sphingomonas sp. QA11]|uniref:hypothetical protein n=1 Tax=Sphingomonas sp. QA11 TaxID=2950605 RepID=UPI00234A3D3B|nr:hypothetical protein [Sphingomonas sp. QA11]WCM28146.1 hypothetical protein NDN01_04265 [Sphingomonas sp. QA11]